MPNSSKPAAPQRPLPLIALNTSTNRLEVSAPARAYLSSLNGTVGVATVAGVCTRKARIMFCCPLTNPLRS
jgi:hypothetical protein